MAIDSHSSLSCSTDTYHQAHIVHHNQSTALGSNVTDCGKALINSHPIEGDIDKESKGFPPGLACLGNMLKIMIRKNGVLFHFKVWSSDKINGGDLEIGYSILRVHKLYVVNLSVISRILRWFLYLCTHCVILSRLHMDMTIA